MIITAVAALLDFFLCLLIVLLIHGSARNRLMCPHCFGHDTKLCHDGSCYCRDCHNSFEVLAGSVREAA